MHDQDQRINDRQAEVDVRLLLLQRNVIRGTIALGLLLLLLLLSGCRRDFSLCEQTGETGVTKHGGYFIGKMYQPRHYYQTDEYICPDGELYSRRGARITREEYYANSE